MMQVNKDIREQDVDIDNTLPDEIINIDLDSAVRRLREFGLGPEACAIALSVDIKYVRQVSRRPLTADEAELSEDVRRLVQLATKRAAFLMEFGSTDVQVSLIKSVLIGTTRFAGNTAAGEIEEARSSLETLFAESRAITIPTTVVTETDIVDVPSAETKALTETTYDQDE